MASEILHNLSFIILYIIQTAKNPLSVKKEDFILLNLQINQFTVYVEAPLAAQVTLNPFA